MAPRAGGPGPRHGARRRTRLTECGLDSCVDGGPCAPLTGKLRQALRPSSRRDADRLRHGPTRRSSRASPPPWSRHPLGDRRRDWLLLRVRPCRRLQAPPRHRTRPVATHPGVKFGCRSGTSPTCPGVRSTCRLSFSHVSGRVALTCFCPPFGHGRPVPRVKESCIQAGEGPRARSRQAGRHRHPRRDA